MATVSFRIDDTAKARLDRLGPINASSLFREVLDRALNELELGEHGKNSLRLSLADRLTLVNQYQVLAELRPELAELYNSYIHILKSGFEIQYVHLVEGFGGGLKEEDSRDILRILDMFSVLTNVLDNANMNPVYREASRFQGFHEQLESEQFVFANYLINELRHYENIRSQIVRHGLSSNVPKLDTYRRMLEVWLACENTYNPTPIEVGNILDAGVGR